MTLKNRIVDISYLKKIKEEIEKFADNYIDEKVRNLLKNINWYFEKIINGEPIIICTTYLEDYYPFMYDINRKTNEYEEKINKYIEKAQKYIDKEEEYSLKMKLFFRRNGKKYV